MIESLCFFYRFHNLVANYGRLAPLADVDLRPLSCAQVELHFGDNTEQLELRLDQTVADLKKQLKPVVQLPVKMMRVYYIDRQLGYALAPQELKYGARALHSYSIRDGDKILVVPKSQ
ncbi:tubulin-specific chaperone cofactor E-like protein [Tachysurus ichikawai]